MQSTLTQAKMWKIQLLGIELVIHLYTSDTSLHSTLYVGADQ